MRLARLRILRTRFGRWKEEKSIKETLLSEEDSSSLLVHRSRFSSSSSSSFSPWNDYSSTNSFDWPILQAKRKKKKIKRCWTLFPRNLRDFQDSLLENSIWDETSRIFYSRSKNIITFHLFRRVSTVCQLDWEIYGDAL